MASQGEECKVNAGWCRTSINNRLWLAPPSNFASEILEGPPDRHLSILESCIGLRENRSSCCVNQSKSAELCCPIDNPSKRATHMSAPCRLHRTARVIIATRRLKSLDFAANTWNGRGAVAELLGLLDQRDRRYVPDCNTCGGGVLPLEMITCSCICSHKAVHLQILTGVFII